MTTLNHLRLVFLGLAAMLAGALAFGLARSPPYAPRLLPQPAALPVPPSPARVARERALIEAQLAETVDYAGFSRKYAAVWPVEWSAVVDGLSSRRLAGGAPGTPDIWFADALRDLRRSRGILAAKAGAAALARIFDSQAATLAALSVLDKHQCVDFLLGQQNQSFLEFSTRHRGLVAAMANAALDAILDGQANNISRGSPSDADFELLESALRAKGLGKPEIDALLDGRYPEPPLPDERLCEAGAIYLDVLKDLPEETRLRLYAFAVELMSRL